MSDLQCPARFILLTTLDGSAADALRHERVAAVYDGPPGPGAHALGRALGVPVQAMARPVLAPEVLGRSADALDVLADLADLHRGETVVVAAGGDPGQRVDVTLDGDGVRVVEVSPGTAR
ncbi:MAG TPA: hypothetical protein VFZ64_08495 [Nocardioidaceae bacterium]